MPTVGERLRQAREQAGLSLQDVAKKTKIQLWILSEIERDDLSRVPGGIFVRGYLRSFGQAVGIDGERLWGDYRAEMRVQTAEPEPAIQADTRRSPGMSRWKIVAIAAALMAAVVTWRMMPGNHLNAVATATPPVRQHVTEVVPTAAPTTGRDTETIAAVDAPATTATAPPAAPLPAPAPEPSPVSAPAASRLPGPSASTPPPASATDATSATSARWAVSVHANSEVWLEAKADGEQRAYRLFEPGEDLALDAQNQIVLRIGDASAVTYTINGAAGRPLGGPGIVREIVVAPDTYQSLIAPN